MMFTHFPTVRNEKYIENVEEIFFDIQFQFPLDRKFSQSFSERLINWCLGIAVLK